MMLEFRRLIFRAKSPLVALSVLFAIGSCTSTPPPKAFGPLPSEAQLQWHEMEMYGLIHYGVDTYTDKEWGFGDEDPSLVNPPAFDAGQIVAAAKAGGLKGVIVVAKHHDGLCLWPTKTTGHNISKSPWKDGKGDMLKEYQLACEKLGMKLGVYCSPWDRNSPLYGTDEYVKVYREQLRELYSQYGPLFISWHDGANGGDGYYGGANEKRNIDRTTYYGWDSTFAITREMQPGAVIFGDIGPDVRWVGNEEGWAGETCWATFTPEAPDEGKKPANGYVKYWLATEGTRNGKYWMPAECDVPLRPGWFYHASQDGRTKTAYQLLDLYYKSVGRGAALDLGLAPTQQGILHEDDVRSLREFGQVLQRTFSSNLASDAHFTATNTRGNDPGSYGPQFLIDNDRYSYWATDDNILRPDLVIDLPSPKTFNVIRLRENIKLGQRITSFAIDVFENGQWQTIANATSIGANRLLRLPQNITASRLRLRIINSDAPVALSDFGLFREPPHLTDPVIKRDRNGFVSIEADAPVASIRYTVDGGEPTTASPVFRKPFSLPEGGIVRARCFESNGKGSGTATKEFGIAKAGWKISSPASSDSSELIRAIDGNEHSVFSFKPGAKRSSQELVVDMGKNRLITAFTFLPRRDGQADGVPDKYVFWVSDDGIDWDQVASGEFANIRSNPVEQLVRFSRPATARYFKFMATGLVRGNALSVAELGIRIK